jgi:hypothetical protein
MLLNSKPLVAYNRTAYTLHVCFHSHKPFDVTFKVIIIIIIIKSVHSTNELHLQT